MIIKKGNFNGFSEKTLDFLRNLKVNNNKTWFEANKQDYEIYLLQPMRNLVFDIGEFMLSIDPYFEIRPAINKTISKIYRDIRFSRNKSLFRSPKRYGHRRRQSIKTGIFKSDNKRCRCYCVKSRRNQRRADYQK